MLKEGEKAKNGTKEMVKRLSQSRQSWVVGKQLTGGAKEFKRVDRQKDQIESATEAMEPKALKGKMDKFLKKRQQIIGQNIKSVGRLRDPLEDLLQEKILI